MSDDKPSAALIDRARYRFWRREPFRFLDMDAQGHINNLAIGALAENSRSFFMAEVVKPALGDAGLLVAVRVTSNFRQELFFPGEVEVGTAVEKLGGSSLTLGQGLFGADGCAATVETVLVLLDADTRRPKPWPDEVRARLQPWLLGD